MRFADGRPRQLRLPTQAGERAETVPSDRALSPRLIARREGYQPPADMLTALIVALRSSPETVNHKALDVGRNVAGLQVRRL
jgi:hypothetical protein